MAEGYQGIIYPLPISRIDGAEPDSTLDGYPVIITAPVLNGQVIEYNTGQGAFVNGGPVGPGGVLPASTSANDVLVASPPVWIEASQLSDTGGTSSVAYKLRRLNDSTALKSVDWNTRQLFGINAQTTPQLDWHLDNAAAVNYMQVMNNATANSPQLTMVGTDANVGFTVQAKGTGSMSFTSSGGSGAGGMLTLINAANTVNSTAIFAATTGNPPLIEAIGSDTNINLSLQPKGTGAVKLGPLLYPTADSTSGYVVTTNGAGVLSLQPGATPTVAGSQTFFVGPFGSDSNVGTADFPFLTIAHANTIVAGLGPTTTTRYTIFIFTQVNSESFNVLANVDYVGDSEFNAQLSGTVSVWNDASWNNGNDNRSALQSLRLTGTVTLSGGASATSCKLYIYNCRFNNAMNATSTASGDIPQYEAQSCHFFGTNTVTGLNANFIACEVGGVTLTSGSASDSQITLGNCTVTGNVTSTRTANTHNVTIYGSSIAGTISTTGSCNLAVSNDSLPPKASQSIASATLSWLGDALPVGYTTASSSYWATSNPTNVRDALDRIAKAVSVNGVSPIGL